MLRLTREVRFALGVEADAQLGASVSNSFGGFPSMTGLGRFYTARVTLAGELSAATQYLLNIKDVDDAVRRWLADHSVGPARGVAAGALLRSLTDHLRCAWPQLLQAASLQLTPTLSISAKPDNPMLRLSQKFEFSASHRLHNPALSDEENRALFGKCNNPLGHGHNYEVQVTLRGLSTPVGETLMALPAFERIVDETVIARFDHKHLNLEVEEFAQTIPTVENIAKVIYTALKPKFAGSESALDSVTVWETHKTWCEYGE